MLSKNETCKLTVCESLGFTSLLNLDGFGMTSKMHVSSMIMEEAGRDGKQQTVFLCGGRVNG